MIQTVLIGVALLSLAILLMGIRVFFTKNGRFPNTHVSGNKAMRDRGITCTTSQYVRNKFEDSPVEKILKSEKL